jgi:CheY-like chemotaxis protein
MIRVASCQVGSDVQLEVCDTGPGIPRENQQRIWAPFFTTKGADLGTGLGLSISREIIERAGGSISLESPAIETADGARGSRFVIRLPAADEALLGRAVEPKVASSPAAAAARVAGSRRRILVVDDEPALARELAVQIGDGPDGHEVVAVCSGEQALAKLVATRFDVVLCDLKMPGMSGEDLYHHVRRQDPEQARRFVFMSGIAFVPEVDHFVAVAGRKVLHKPFPAQRVLEVIAEVGAGA